MIRSLLAILSLFLASSAMACSFIGSTDEERFATANTIFRARVIETHLSTHTDPFDPSAQTEIVEARYQLLEVFKGNPLESGVVRDLTFGVGNCSLGLMVGLEYVFFPSKQGYVLLPSGSFTYLNANDSEVKQRLDRLRKFREANQK